ncbi:hypothetical protein [Herbaspirillum rhizosphaerae]|nr:hypothetical protein [Herbaspirillum rhizosphaerae]
MQAGVHAIASTHSQDAEETNADGKNPGAMMRKIKKAAEAAFLIDADD